MPTPADPATLADPDFPHRTERGYFRGCGGTCCRAAHKRADIERKIAVQAEGHLTDMLARTQTHLLDLLDYGTVNDVVRVSGCRWKVVHGVVSGQSGAARRDNLRALLATTPEHVREGTYWGDRALAEQQIGSLMRLGWQGEYLTRRLGVKVTDLYRREQITAETGRRIAALYAEIGDTRGPSPVTAARARRAGWRVPGAYDEHGRLIPGAALEDETPEFRRKWEIAERRRQVKALYGAKVPVWEIAERLGISSSLVCVDLKRAVRPVDSYLKHRRTA